MKNKVFEQQNTNETPMNFDEILDNNLSEIENLEDHEGILLVNKLFNSLVEGIMITDCDSIIRFINPAFSEITGYKEEIIGKTPRILKSGKHNQEFYKNLWKSVREQGQWKGEIWNKRKNGEIYAQWATIIVIKDDYGAPLYFASVITDITERKKSEQKLQNDLNLALKVQKSLLGKPIENDQVQIEGIYLPSVMLGGDMYTWYQLDDHQYGIFLLDVMGKGLASALVSMSVRSLLRGLINHLRDPIQVMNELNQHIYSLYRENDSGQNYYLTAIYVLINTETKTIEYTSAGHPPGIFVDEYGRISELNLGTVPLGLLSEIDVEKGRLNYSNNSTIILYTDGIIDDENQLISGRIEQLKTFILQNHQLPLTQLMENIVQACLSENHRENFPDDATLVGIKIF